MRPPPIRMSYVSSWLNFHRDSESEVRTLKFHQWHIIWLYLNFSHIWPKLDLHQSWWSIYHLDPFFTEILNLKSELWNSISGTSYDHICVLALFQGIEMCQIWIPLMDLQISDFRFRISVKIQSRIYIDHHDWGRSNFQYSQISPPQSCARHATHMCVSTYHK